MKIDAHLGWAMLEAIPQAVIATSNSGDILYLNLAAQCLLDHTASEVRARPLNEILRLRDGRSRRPIPAALHHLLSRDAALAPGEFDWLARRDGSEIPVEHTITPLRDSGNVVIGLLLLLRDASPLHTLVCRLTERATHDGLTRLVNRDEFERRLARLLAARRLGEAHALLYIDLDGFKSINDTGGHAAGDHVLRTVARRLGAVIRERDTLARIGGDEFALLLEHCQPVEAEVLALELADAVAREECRFGEHRFHVTASIGVAAISDQTHGLRALLAQADHACYAAKRGGTCAAGVASAR